MLVFQSFCDLFKIKLRPWDWGGCPLEFGDARPGAILREILLEGLKDSRAKQQRAECLMEAPQNERIISTLAVSDGGPFKVPRTEK
eukprot:4780893-Amphidinium_carterae.1